MLGTFVNLLVILFQAAFVLLYALLYKTMHKTMNDKNFTRTFLDNLLRPRGYSSWG